MRSLRRLALALVVSLAGAAPVAVAGPEGAPPGSPDSREQRARRLFREGSQLYDQTEFDAAIARFEEAYQLSNLPALLFNIAQAYRLKGPGQCAIALRYYQRYLRDEPETSNRQEIEELIQEMQVCAAAQDAPIAPALVEPVKTAAPIAPLPVEADVAPRPSRWPRWLAIFGGSTLVVGAGGYAAALAKYESVKNGGPYPRGTFRSWELVTDASYGLMAAGGAATLVSTVWWLGHRSPEPAPRLSLSLGLGPLVRVDGRF